MQPFCTVATCQILRASCIGYHISDWSCSVGSWSVSDLYRRGSSSSYWSCLRIQIGNVCALIAAFCSLFSASLAFFAGRLALVLAACFALYSSEQIRIMWIVIVRLQRHHVETILFNSTTLGPLMAKKKSHVKRQTPKIVKRAVQSKLLPPPNSMLLQYRLDDLLT
jgi:hypothetical protein